MIRVFYDGKCGLCSKEINHYRRIARNGVFNWPDITESAEDLKKRRQWIILMSIIAIILIGGILVGPIMSNVENPSYKVVSSVNNIEIREYSPMIIAEVEVSGEREKSIGDGFRLLADYIFGNNTVSQDIAMTAPVQQQANEKIAMTAPVQQQISGDVWLVNFVMPSEYTMETLPKPNNERVIIKEVLARKYVTIQFSGKNSNGNIAKHEAKLMQYIETNNLQFKGTPKYAFYNPPWTLPLMRRNEVMIEIMK